MSICSKRRKTTDILQNCFRFTCDPSLDPIPQDLWIENGLVNSCGTFVLKVEQACDGVRVFVNGEEVTVDDTGASTPLLEGQSLALTVDPLESIQAVCVGAATGTCILTLCLTINYECC